MTSTILLIGAKSTDQPLESVPFELNRIKEQFKQSNLALRPEYEPYLTFESLGDLLRSVTDQVGILHFAGHSESDKLMVNGDVVYSKHIAGLLKTWTAPPSLVFLNGCRSSGQVKELHEAGVKNVIATRSSVGDENAANFAKAFYAELLSRPEKTTIKQAFDRAGITAFLNRPGGPRSMDLEETTEIEWDWGLYTKTNSSNKLSLSDVINVEQILSPSKRVVTKPALESIITSSKPQEYDIFISYRTARRPWVETLAYNLQQQGYKVFLDAWELSGGDNFTRKIYNALENSKYALLIATPEATESGWVQEEYEYMFNRAKQDNGFRWIPVVLGEFPDFPFLSNVLAVNFKDSSTNQYRIAFQKLLNGLNKEPSGASPYFADKLELPETEMAQTANTGGAHKLAFINEVWSRLDASIPLMVLAQADTNTQHYIHALKQSLADGYPRATFLHLFPPASTHADRAAYFGRLAKQCDLDLSITESWQWADALRERLDKDQEIVLLITGFENGTEGARGELAGELRGLLSSHPHSLKLIVMGSEQLAAAKYSLGEHSFFNDLDEMRLPDVSLQDLRDIYLNRYRNLKIDEETLLELLAFTGKHPRLLESSLQCLKRGDRNWQTSIKNSPIGSQLFNKFQNETDMQRLQKLLGNTNLGRYDAWPQDNLIRKLYWQNLLTEDNGLLVWRCQFIFETGRSFFSKNLITKTT